MRCECGTKIDVSEGTKVTIRCFCGSVHHVNGGSLLSSDLRSAGRAAWTALHTMQQPTPDKIVAWLDTVPSYSCKCREFAVKYIKDNPPPYDDQATFFEWTWLFHDTVDQKTGDQRMTLEEAREFWG